MQKDTLLYKLINKLRIQDHKSYNQNQENFLKDKNFLNKNLNDDKTVL